MPLYDVWWKVGGATKPIDKQWRIIGQLELPYPYWGAEPVRDGYFEDSPIFKDVFWAMKEMVGRASEAARRAFNNVLVHRLRMRTVVEPVTVIHFAGNSGPRTHVQQWAITPPYNVLYDLRNDPHGNEHGAEAFPFVWGLPGLVADRGYVMRGGTPWPAPVEVPVNVEGKNLAAFRVALDQALERGLADFDEIRGQSISDTYAYISFKKVKVGPEATFRKRYGGRAVSRKLSFVLRASHIQEGKPFFTFHIDDLGWYPSHLLVERLRKLAEGGEVQLVNNSMVYKLAEEDLQFFSVWLDAVLERGLL